MHIYRMSRLTTSVAAVLVNNKKKQSFEVVLQSCMLTQYQYFTDKLIFPFSALIRPGRFDMQVTVPKPDVKGRTEILKWYLKKIKVDPG